MPKKIDIYPVTDMNGLTLLRVDAITRQVVHDARHPMNTYVLSYATDGSYIVSHSGVARGKNRRQHLADLRAKNEERLVSIGKSLSHHQDIHAHLRCDILRIYKNGM